MLRPQQKKHSANNTPSFPCGAPQKQRHQEPLHLSPHLDLEQIGRASLRVRPGDGHLLIRPIGAGPEVVRGEDGPVSRKVRVQVAGIEVRRCVVPVEKSLCGVDPIRG